MVGRRSLIAIAASALLLVGGQSAAFAADDEGVPFQQLVQVYVPDMAAVDTVVANYDATEYKSVQDDGSILLAVFVTAEEKAALKAKGYEIGRVIEDSNTGAQRMKERQEIIDQEAVAADVAENGLKGARFEGRSVAAVPGQGDTVIQRADVFTNAVGPPTNRTTARFLYVEAHNKSTKRVPGSNTAFTGPALALSFAGPDGVYSTPVNMGRNIDNMLTPNEYMYHRQLVRLTGRLRQPRGRRHPASRRHRGHRRRRRGQHRDLRGLRVARRQPPAARRGLQDPVLHEVPGSDRDPRRPRRAGGGVPGADERPEHARADLGLPAQGAGDHERHGRDRLDCNGRLRPPAGEQHGRDHGRAAGRLDPVHR